MINLIGKVLMDRFRVDAFVASGGMSVVYRVWDVQRNVPLAMKVLHTDMVDDPSVMKSFQREARALQKLTHPHIVPFYGLYQTQEITFMVEHYVDGLSLKEILRATRGQRLTSQDALCYLKALSSALGYAHTYGVVHCDVKPGNVMIDSGGNIYLTDFGVARHAESTTTTLASAGTPAYMAPEQIRGESVSAATDIYALGVLFFELLTGQRPFAGMDTGSDSGGATAAERVRYAHLTLSPPDPRSFTPDIPEALVRVIYKSLAKNALDRYTEMSAFFTDACHALGASPEKVLDRVSPPTLSDLHADTSGSSKPSSVAGYGGSRRTWVILAILALVLFLCGGAFIFGGLPIIQKILATPTSTSTNTPTITMTFTPTDTPTHTLTPTFTATDIPTSTPTRTPTPTRRNTQKPRPTSTPVSSSYSIKINNRFSYEVFVFRNGKYLGSIPSMRYLVFKGIKSGAHEFQFCQSKEMSGCKIKNVTINGDTEITVP